jgi:hypothetical protein
MEYVDERGCHYRVIQGLEGIWKGCYRKPDQLGQKLQDDDAEWKCVTSLFWRKTKREAEHDLAVYAKHKGMRVKDDGGEEF